MSSQRPQLDLAVTLRSPTCGAAPGEPRVRQPSCRSVQVHASVRRRVWAPLLLRGVAVALAVLGLAGIGRVAARAPELGTALAPASGLSLGALSGQLAALGTGDPRRIAGAAWATSVPPRATAGPGPLREPGSAELASVEEAVTAPSPAGVPSPAAPSRAAGDQQGARDTASVASPCACIPQPGAARRRSRSPQLPSSNLAAPGLEATASSAVGTPSAPGAVAAASAPPPSIAEAAPGASSDGASAGDSPSGSASASGSAGTSRSAVDERGRVVLNRAGVSELMRLPGIGARRAEAIVELRQRLGRFRRPSDLLRIKGIGPRTLERLLREVVLD